MKRIGIFGGTFDPVHNAHLELARLALEQYELDTVLFIPAGKPVRKLGTTEASAQDRLHMLKLACQGMPGFQVSSIEVDRPHVSYTIDTLRKLKQIYDKESELFLILGEDTTTDLSTWKDSSEIAQLAQVIYANRPDDNVSGITVTKPLPRGFICHELTMPERHISSSYVRRLLRQGRDVSTCIPPSTIKYIEEHGLYGRSQ